MPDNGDVMTAFEGRCLPTINEHTERLGLYRACVFSASKSPKSKFQSMTTYATGCSESGVLRFSCKVTDFARYNKEDFILSSRVLSFCTKTAKEKLTL